MYEYFMMHKDQGKFELFDLVNVEQAFDRIDNISYQENVRIKDHDTELVLTALPSGHSIGGCIWKIEYNR